MTNKGQEQEASGKTSVIPVWFMTVVAVPILIGVLWVGQDFFVPIVMATLLYILTVALIDRLDSATLGGASVPRPVAYVVATLLVIGLVVGFGYGISSQAASMAEAAPRYAERLTVLQTQLEQFLGAERVAAAERALQSADVEQFLADFAASAAGMIGTVGLIILYLAFMLAERGALAEKLPRLCKTETRAHKVEEIMTSISSGVTQYMWINAVTSAMSATLSFVVLKFLGVDFALTLALAVFLLNFIPSIGTFLAIVMQVSMALLQFDTLTPALVIVVVYGGGDSIIGNIIQPRMQGKTLNISTFIVMVALAFWGILWGGIGAFIAVPLTVVIMIVCSHVPGLQSFARLLSSDGLLLGEEPSAPLAKGQIATSGPQSDIETEIAAMKQELLNQRSSRQHDPKTEAATGGASEASSLTPRDPK